MRIRHVLSAAVAGVLALGLVGCASNGASSSAASPETGKESGAYPITIKHALGTTTIPEKPRRVAAIAWGNQDVALALGVKPVGIESQVWAWSGKAPLGVYPWTENAIKKLGGTKPVIFKTGDSEDFEAISDTKPDVILAALSGLSKSDYATLTKIAPTVAYPKVAWFTPWRQQIEMDATAMGLKKEGEQLVGSLDKQIAAATAHATAIKGKTAAFFYADPSDVSKVSIYTGGDPRTAFLADLGFTEPKLASDAAKSGKFYQDVSAENADQLDDVDVIVSYGDETLLPALQASPLWSKVPAVKNGAVVAVGNGDAFSAATTPTALSIPWVLKKYVAKLDAAAAKVK